MIIKRWPREALFPFIRLLWASDDATFEASKSSERERMIPTGSMHVVYRLSENPIRIFESIDDKHGHAFSFGVVSGLRSRFYIKDVARPVRTVGAILQPGVSRFLFGIPAQELAGRHTSIDELWGQSSIELLEQLQEETCLQQQLNVFESFLTNKVPQLCSIHPAVAYALNCMLRTGNVIQIVKETGYSHKHFIELFRTTVGLSPKLYCRIIRFQHALKMIGDPKAAWIDIALQAKYSDQAHFNREFREFTGISPGEYRNSASESHHVPMLF